MFYLPEASGETGGRLSAVSTSSGFMGAAGLKAHLHPKGQNEALRAFGPYSALISGVSAAS